MFGSFMRCAATNVSLASSLNIRRWRIELAVILAAICIFAPAATAVAQFQPFPQSQNNGQFGGQSFGQTPSVSSRPRPIGNQSGADPRYGTAASSPAYRTAAVPSIPSIPTDVDPVIAGEEAVDESAGWALPAFAKKITDGGWLMFPLGVCSLIVFTLSLERLIALRRGRVIPRPFVRRFTESVEDGQLSYEEATEICEEFDCPVAEVFQAAVRRWGRPMFEIEQAVMDAGDRVSDSLRRFVRVFHAIANVAPLMGLLGTVLGMIEAFEMISSPDSIGRPEVLASGISKALMTTAGGLCVAIPAYLAYMYFSSKSDRYLGEIDKLCQKVIDSISAEGLENTSAQKPARKRRAA